MCGIAGVLSRHARDRDAATMELNVMAAAIAHRGPDHQGCWTSDDARGGLSHRRLSIIDLSDAGRQPMRSASGRFQISFNGEIYNYIELAAELRAAGVTFGTASDTEVLLAGFERWGVVKTLEKVAGMFALGLWDHHRNRLTLARDRAGKKPLYISRDGDRLYFASEIKALRAVGRGGNIDREALHHYLSLGYIPGPRTIYDGITEIGPGTVVEFAESLAAEVTRYWEYPAGETEPVDFEAAVTETQSRLREAVRLRLRADVPVGVFLSGGIDSGLLVALAAAESRHRLRTFTISFGAKRFDESEGALAVAKRYDTDHTLIRVEPDVEALVPIIAAAYDEPFADPSAIPTYVVAGAAAQHVRVVLNGEGADELFAGYRRAWAARAMERFNFVPRGVAAGLHGVLPAPRAHRSKYAFAHRFLAGLGAPLGERYIAWSSDGFTELEKRSLYRDAPAVPSTPERLVHGLRSRGELERFMELDFRTGMTDCLLPKMDIASMAHGLEARCPFLDQRVIEWAARLPRSVIFKGRETKPVLRALAAQLLPAEIVAAPKRGFEIPLADWIDGDLGALVRDTISSRQGIIDSLFERPVLSSLIDAKATGDRERRAKLLWILTMLGQWDQSARRSAKTEGRAPTHSAA
jgi:asparagine synthase (glutamine-hydrolysing)